MSSSVDQCVFNNNPNHDITKQLQDGIRAFDMDACAQGKDKVIFCHAQSEKARAIGHAVDKTFDHIKAYLDANKREVIVLEIGDMTGKCNIIMPYLMKELTSKFGPMLIEHENGKPWPTLGELIKTNKRVAVFLGHCLKHEKKPPKWALNRGLYYRSSWHRTAKHSKNPKDVIKFATDFCSKPNPKHSKHWRCMDFEYSPNLEEAKKYLSKFSVPKGLCIPDIAKEINPLLHKVVKKCGEKFHVHRVRVDYYWASKFIEDVKTLNKDNVKKYIHKKK